MKLMQDYHMNNLDTHPYKEEIQDDLQINCYKLHMAHMLYEIIHRQTKINKLKLKAVKDIESDFKSQFMQVQKSAKNLHRSAHLIPEKD